MTTTQYAKPFICTLIGTVGSAILNFLGGGDSMLLALVILMCIDFVTGLIVALFWQSSPKSDNGGVSSKACWQGILKKFCTLLVVAVANQADILLGIDYVRNAVVIAFCVAEIISICENTGEMGILPYSVQKIFNKVIDLLNDKADTSTTTSEPSLFDDTDSSDKE